NRRDRDDFAGRGPKTAERGPVTIVTDPRSFRWSRLLRPVSGPNGSRSAQAERLAPQGHHRYDIVGFDLDLDEGPRLRVAGATGQADGLVGPGHRAAGAAEVVADLMRLVAEVVGLLEVEDVERRGLARAERQLAAALDAARGITFPGAAGRGATFDTTAADVDLAAHHVTRVDLAALGT